MENKDKSNKKTPFNLSNTTTSARMVFALVLVAFLIALSLLTYQAVNVPSREPADDSSNTITDTSKEPGNTTEDTPDSSAATGQDHDDDMTNQPDSAAPNNLSEPEQSDDTSTNQSTDDSQTPPPPPPPPLEAGGEPSDTEAINPME